MGEHVRVVVRLRPLPRPGTVRRRKNRKEESLATVENGDLVRVQVTPQTTQIFRCDCALGPSDDQDTVFQRSGGSD